VIVENKLGAGSCNAIEGVMKVPDTQKRLTDTNMVPVVTHLAQTEARAQALD
jgi:hypothetical protein